MPALTDAVRAAVQRKQWRTAASLLNSLASFGTRARSALAVVLPLAEADDTEVRTAAGGALWEIERRPESAVPLLEGLLDHGRNFDAIDVLGRIGPPAAAVLPRLRQMLDKQVEQHARNEQNGAAVLDDSWALVRVASALWDMGREGEAHVVVPALLNAWKDNDFTARDAAGCLDRMGPAAQPALPRIQVARAQPHRGGHPWGWGVAYDLEFQDTCRMPPDPSGGIPDPPLTGEERPPPQR
ncbi:hypothetical protein [Streptomyces virginiae]